MKLRHVVALMLLAACANEGPAPPPGPPQKPIVIPPPSDAEERTSLLDLGRGSAIVSRTGEIVLEMSALGAIDGDPTTQWMNPPNDLPQSLVASFAAKTRIEKIGVRSVRKNRFAAKQVDFDVSNDGRTFTPLARMTLSDKGDVQWRDVPPTEASYVRVTLDAANGHDVQLQSALVRGRELEPPHSPRLQGCWNLNGRQANFFEHGARVDGTIVLDRTLLSLDGGSDGRIVRFEWIRGPEFGYAVMTTSPDGRRMSGIEWHEEPIPLFFSDAWFGEPGQCTAVAHPLPVAEEFLQRTGRHSLFGIRFRDDGSIDAAASADALAQLRRLMAGKRMRIVAHEFREADAAGNRARAQREIDALKRQLTQDELARVTFVAAGSDDPRQIPGSEAARELYSTVDLEVER